MKKLINYFTPVGEEQKCIAIGLAAVIFILFLFPILSIIL